MLAAALLLVLPILPGLGQPPGAPPGAPPPGAPPPGTAAPPVPGEKAPEQQMEELQAIIAETNPLLFQLGALQERYKNPRAIRGTIPERQRLLAGISERLGRFSKLFEEFSDLHRELATARGYQALAQFMSGKMPKDAAEIINKSYQHNNFGREARGWMDRAFNIVATDQTAFNLGMRAAKQQQLLAIAIGVLLVVALVALFLWRRAAKAKAQLETDISRLAASTGSGRLIDLATPGTPLAGVTPAATILGGNYVVERELGRGGMGIVYEATDLSLRRKVAIKQIRREVQEQLQDMEKLLSEARLVANLKHPNIVEIHSIFREKGGIYLVFEHVAGRTLQDILRERIRLTVRQARSVLHQVGAALDYAHQSRIIHRDLKPSNVMVTNDGIAKVMDFGIAHQSKSSASNVTQSQAWGTPPYMAPEQEQGSISRESDLYALGVMAYEMLTGRLPFNGPDFLEQKRSMRFFPPSKAAAGLLPPALDPILSKALSADPAERFHSAAEIITALGTVPDAVA